MLFVVLNLESVEIDVCIICGEMNLIQFQGSTETAHQHALCVIGFDCRHVANVGLCGK